MPMTSAPHLLNEDKPEFGRLLDEALRTAHERPELSAVGERLNTEQLRTMALNAGALLTAAASAEYEHYVKVRAESRDGTAAVPFLETDGEAHGAGAGATAVVAVLAPVLAGTAMLIFLLVGYLLKLLDPPPAFADTMLTAGWFFGALTAAAILCAAIGLLLTAVRNSATEVPADREETVSEEIQRAREAWRHALLERGIMPFLQDALADPSADPSSTVPRRPPGRLPRPGYESPGFTSPGSHSGSQRPGFTSPAFTSPDFGGPAERSSEEEGPATDRD
ncbi:hypothetical protein [Streptomyces sp. NPDC097619]|uniref:hypothetical protein n=1 Tax=Streptomyces sp. NPDC097619 TaxID=3157228 RepID=UPI00331AE684